MATLRTSLSLVAVAAALGLSAALATAQTTGLELQQSAHAS